MIKHLDFIMRLILEERLGELGVVTSSSRTLDLSEYSLKTTSTLVEVGSVNNTKPFSDRSTWVQGTLVKIPTEEITRGDCNLVHKKGMYTIFIKTLKSLGEHVNEAVSAEVEKHFQDKEHISRDDILLTVTKTYQQPSVYLEGDTGRYWNRVFIECEIYDKKSN